MAQCRALSPDFPAGARGLYPLARGCRIRPALGMAPALMVGWIEGGAGFFLFSVFPGGAVELPGRSRPAPGGVDLRWGGRDKRARFRPPENRERTHAGDGGEGIRTSLAAWEMSQGATRAKSFRLSVDLTIPQIAMCSGPLKFSGSVVGAFPRRRLERGVNFGNGASGFSE